MIEIAISELIMQASRPYVVEKAEQDNLLFENRLRFASICQTHMPLALADEIARRNATLELLS